ncbi:MAG: adenylate/guanylate cyclase domain-containing protein [Microcoleaceae cyanobacterium]
MTRKKTKHPLWKKPEVSVIFLTVIALIFVLRSSGKLQLLEWMALDLFFRLRPAETIDPKIVIVTIDETDITNLNQWPMSDQQLVQLLEKLKSYQPRVIGLDLYRDLPVPPGYQQLLDLFQSTPNLIGIEKAGGLVAPPATLKQLDQVGTSDIILDADGRVRRALLMVFDEEGYTFSLAMKLALKYLASEGIYLEELDPQQGSLKLGEAVFKPLQPQDGGYIQADVGGYQFIINYRSRPCQDCQQFETVSISDILNGNVDPDLIGSRIAMIGATADSLKDLFLTPDSNITPGIEVHAQITSQIVNAALNNRRLIQVWPDWIENTWVIFWAVVSAVTSWKFVQIRWKLLNLFLTHSILCSITFLAFLSGWWLPIVPAILAMLTLQSSITLYKAYLEREDRQIVMNLLAQQMSPKVAHAVWDSRHQLLGQGHLMGQDLMATVLFTDIQGFTSIAERTDSQTLMAWLNEYMNMMSQIVLDHDGVVDKFIGDAVMAVFGIPFPRNTAAEINQDAVAAVRCAIEMKQQLSKLNQQWQKKGLPTAKMRVGIATGWVVAGSLGGLRRQNYTIIGDTVNIAARLEAYDKSIDNGICRILISEETYQSVEDQFSTQLIGEVKLRGKQKTVSVYQVL